MIAKQISNRLVYASKMKIFFAVIVCMIASLLQAGSLQIDFGTSSSSVESDYHPYTASNEQPVTFTTRSYSAFGTMVSVTPSWASGAEDAAMQILNRTNLNGYTDGTEELMSDWIGTDTRSVGDPMTLMISGLPAGTYSWVSYHHDVDASNTHFFDVTVTDATGPSITTDVQITNTIGDLITTIEGVGKFETTIVSDGSDITLVFNQQPWTFEYNDAWFIMNGFGISDSIPEAAWRSNAPLRRPISEQQPMWLVHIDTWNYADPQKIIDLIPEDIRPFVVMNISLSISHDEETSRFKVAEYGYEIAKSWLRACAENQMWAMVQPSSGGYSQFSDFDLSVYEEFYRDYPNMIGFNYCEQFWGYDSTTDPLSAAWTDRIAHFANLLELSDRYGGYLVVSWCGNQWSPSINPIAMLKRIDAFRQACRDHTDNYILCEKYTQQSYQSDMESLCLGAWLSGYSGQYGIRYDDTGWTDANGDHDNFTMATYGAPFLEHVMLTGQTVIDAPELIWTQCFHEISAASTSNDYTMRRWGTFPQFDNVSVDLFRKILDGTVRIPSRQEVIDRTKVVIINDVNSGSNDDIYSSPETLFEGLYRMDGDENYGENKNFFKKTGRYPTVPTVYQLDDALANTFQVQVDKSVYSNRWPTISSKVAEFDSLFSEEYTGDIYAGRYENGWVTYNPFKTGQIASGSIPFKYNTCDHMELVYSQYTAGVIKEYSDSLTIYLSNYDNVLDTGLKTDVIKIYGSTSEPTYSYIDRASHQASLVSSSWAGGVFTLTVQHNGPLDITVNCAGTATGRLTSYTTAAVSTPAEPLVYTGPVQYEAECFDYKSIFGIVKGGYSEPVRNYTGQGYMQFGTSLAAVARDTVTVLKSGTYRLETRYSVTGEDITTVDLYVNGTKFVTPTFFQTAALSDWSINKQNITLDAGENTIEFMANAAGASSLYFDSIVIVPAAYGNGIRIQENETGFVGVEGMIDNTYSGYTGDGYANTNDSIGVGIDYELYFGPAATKSFTFRYACPDDRIADLIVNGEIIASEIQFSSTGSWSTWDFVTVYASAEASAELSGVRLQATSATGLPNVDFMEMTGGGVETTPPAAPTGLTVTAITTTRIDLDWDDNAESDMAGYNVFRSTIADGPYILIASGIAASDYIDNMLTEDTTYYYVVTAVDTSSNASGNSNEASTTTYTGSGQYQESNGVVSMEAENGIVGSRWMTESDAGASNDAYIEINPVYDNPSGAPACITAECITAYDFNISTSGNYRFWFRMFSGNAADDSFFWRIDSGSWIQENNRSGIGSWFSTDHTQLDNLSTGGHVLEIAYRENGTRLDKFVIQLDILTSPTGDGPVQSSQIFEASNCQHVQSQGYRLDADLNGDCHIGMGDLILLTDQWLSTSLVAIAPNYSPDLVVDNEINLADFAAMADQWLTCNDPEVAGCIRNW